MRADAPARQVRGLANGVAVTANWSANALVAQTFLSLARALGPAGVFWLYAAVAAAGAAWVYLALPETAGAPAPAPRAPRRAAALAALPRTGSVQPFGGSSRRLGAWPCWVTAISASSASPCAVTSDPHRALVATVRCRARAGLGLDEVQALFDGRGAAGGPAHQSTGEVAEGLQQGR